MNRRHFIALTSLTAATRMPAAPSSTDPLKVGLLTDVQYADAKPSGNRHYRESLPKLRAAIDDLAAQNLTTTLHLGDVIDRDFDSFGAILPAFEPLGHPVRHLLGNHDYDLADAKKSQVPETLGMPSDYYDFVIGNRRFIMLDTTEVSIYKYPENHPKTAAAKTELAKLAKAEKNYAQPWNGGISEAQLSWLDQQLTAADRADQPTIICSHHPLYPVSPHQTWNHPEIIATIEKHRCVQACFSGHNHGGKQGEKNGIHYITFKSILQKPGVTAYCELQFSPEKLAIIGRGREASREIALRPVAKPSK